MITVIFDSKAKNNEKVKDAVQVFLGATPTLETEENMPIVIFQDGASKAYYIKCSLLAEHAQSLCDLDAKLDIGKPESYRANRELLLKNRTYRDFSKRSNMAVEIT